MKPGEREARPSLACWRKRSDLYLVVLHQKDTPVLLDSSGFSLASILSSVLKRDFVGRHQYQWASALRSVQSVFESLEYLHPIPQHSTTKVEQDESLQFHSLPSPELLQCILRNTFFSLKFPDTGYSPQCIGAYCEKASTFLTRWVALITTLAPQMICPEPR